MVFNGSTRSRTVPCPLHHIRPQLRQLPLPHSPDVAVLVAGPVAGLVLEFDLAERAGGVRFGDQLGDREAWGFEIGLGDVFADTGELTAVIPAQAGNQWRSCGSGSPPSRG